MTRFRPFTRLLFATLSLLAAVLTAQAAYAQDNTQEPARFVIFEAFMRPA